MEKSDICFKKDNLLEWRNIMDNITIGLGNPKEKN